MMPPPGARAAMLAAATRSRCPSCPQCGQLKFRPAGLGTRRAQRGQVEDVPRSSTRCTVIPAASALSDRARIRCPTRQSRVRWLCRRPALRSSTPRGSPTARVPIRLLHGPGDDLLGGLVLGLADPPGVPGLGFPLAAAVLAPPARPALPGLGGAGGGGAGAALAVAQVLPAFGPDRPPGHQQPLPFRSGGGVGVDDAQVDPGGPARVRPLPGRVDRDRDLGGHVRVQPPRVVAEGHRPDLPGRVGDVPVQPDRQRGAAARHRDPQHPPVERERAVIPADRDQAAPAPRVPGASCRRPCGVWRWRTRRRCSGAAPTGRRCCRVPRTCPARRRPAPGTAPGSRPAAGPAGAAARRLSSSTQHHTSPAERSSPNTRSR